MKKIFLILIFLYGVNLSYVKNVFPKGLQKLSKYTEQYSIKTNISGHKLRIFTLVSNPKSSKKKL